MKFIKDFLPRDLISGLNRKVSVRSRDPPDDTMENVRREDGRGREREMRSIKSAVSLSVRRKVRRARAERTSE